MKISGNLLPLPSSSVNQGLSDNRQPLSERQLESEHKNRQQTVEYVFKGEILEDVSADERNQNPYMQSIDPANLGAISSYVNSYSAVSRQGQLVDIFI
ncbi:MAG: hypothetical protein GY744_16435 [Gammaproteobacteria bacterium]|nr:hypothetical protein [Gammaproteobacteria bacterium]